MKVTCSRREEIIWLVCSGCYAEPRVGESIRSKYNVRNKLAKTEGRSNECEYLIPASTKREGKLCQPLDPEIVGLIRLCFVEVHKFYMPIKRMVFLIETYEYRDSMFRGYKRPMPGAVSL